ncbi:MAG TPA: DNA-3-methyladenine glycosylase I [Leeuwenhoekiella sp.]|nr:DNA-3-methyladenine glycosylase I [Leeuwenhoekiella sp.]
MSQHKCGWCLGDPLYEAYHDKEWGVPVYHDQTFFEFLVLESFQAGLSWITVLRKRKNFREAFDDFDYQKIAMYNEKKVEQLLQNEGIIRNKLKVRSAITNAQEFIRIQKEFGSFSDYVWSFVDGKAQQHDVENYKEAPATTPESEALSKDLKKRGFKFMGPTVMYAFMQATGMVNDHEKKCFRYTEVKKMT